MQFHRGRLIDHVQLVVKDLAAARRFYDAAFGALDPDGNNIEAVFQGLANCSAPSMVIVPQPRA